MAGRFVVYGPGAVGGVIAGGLAGAGHDVALIARGDHLLALQADGLTFHHHGGTDVHRLRAVADPGDLALTADDVVILAMKTQHTEAAIDVLARSAPPELAVVCAQNGVTNERLALRRFANVHGVAVMLPGTHLKPGVVVGLGRPWFGVLDIGRYPAGVDATTERVAAALTDGNFRSVADPAVMRHKYAKLRLNTGNAIDAAAGLAARRSEVGRRAAREALEVFSAAGIDVATRDEVTARRDGFETADVPGHERAGSSSWQSLARGGGSIEADFLNGEIVLLGRLHGVATPVNEALQRLANRLAADGVAPGSMSLDEVEALVLGR
ncbi:MAG: 2-dehydropantoate 2-reductase N-terminal domain-containing protein [Actinomycetota bacterium]